MKREPRTTPSATVLQDCVLIHTSAASSSKDEAWESSLRNAKRKRDVAAALMERDWLGIHILTVAREHGHLEPDLLPNAERRPGDVLTTSVRLLALNLLHVAAEGFLVCTPEAERILDRLSV